MHQPPFGFAVWRGHPAVMSDAHTHSDVELNYLVSGGATYFLAGQFKSLSTGRLALFWAGTPHQLVATKPATEMIWVTIPLAWMLQWHLPAAFTERLLRGDLIAAAQADPMEVRLMTRWVNELKSNHVEIRRIVMLEVEARVRRLALIAKGKKESRSAGIGPIEKITQYVSRHYTEELSIGQIAQAVGLHPNYAMQVFKRQTGMRLWDYVIRLRVAHAQRLLLMTHTKIIDIAMECGFGSASRFYEAFHRVSGHTPRDYQRSLGQAAR